MLCLLYREHKKMSMEMEDLENKMKDIMFMKVTREIQAVSRCEHWTLTFWDKLLTYLYNHWLYLLLQCYFYSYKKNTDGQKGKPVAVFSKHALISLFQFLNESDYDAKKASEISTLEQTILMQRKVSNKLTCLVWRERREGNIVRKRGKKRVCVRPCVYMRA